MIGCGDFKGRQTLNIRNHCRHGIIELDEESLWCAFSMEDVSSERCLSLFDFSSRTVRFGRSATTIDRPMGIIPLIKPCQDAR